MKHRLIWYQICWVVALGCMCTCIVTMLISFTTTHAIHTWVWDSVLFGFGAIIWSFLAAGFKPLEDPK